MNVIEEMDSVLHKMKQQNDDILKKTVKSRNRIIVQIIMSLILMPLGFYLLYPFFGAKGSLGVFLMSWGVCLSLSR